jgi:SAM-dependent methyltransferase
MHCRFCRNSLKHQFVSLGHSPLANSYLDKQQTQKMEPFYPLEAYVCDNCFLVQVAEFESPQSIFGDYAYFSSYSQTWLDHAKKYAEFMKKNFSLGPSHRVVEIASNDGYLLQYFQALGVPVLGIEPAANVAKVANDRGIPTQVEFFGRSAAKKLVAENKGADLLVANNVFAHVPNLDDFVGGFKTALKPKGIITVEFPHLLNLMRETQFDTIYHEHFSYFSFFTTEKVFAAHGLKVFDVEEMSTHGGSLRVFGCHGEDDRAVSDRVLSMRKKEKDAGIERLDTYLKFAEDVVELKRNLLSLLIDLKNKGKTIVGYGAPAKGNTLLNYCGIRSDFLDYTVDKNLAKQGKYLPGSHIPIFAPEKIQETKPDYIFILPWNIKEEVLDQLSFARKWGCKFIVPIPKPRILE